MVAFGCNERFYELDGEDLAVNMTSFWNGIDEDNLILHMSFSHWEMVTEWI